MYGKLLRRHWGATESLSSGFHAQTNGQMERTNQNLEAVRCVAEANPSSWSAHLTWVEYGYNSLTSFVSGFSPLKYLLATSHSCFLPRK